MVPILARLVEKEAGFIERFSTFSICQALKCLLKMIEASMRFIEQISAIINQCLAKFQKENTCGFQCFP
jgi:hypothetical protein